MALELLARDVAAVTSRSETTPTWHGRSPRPCTGGYSRTGWIEIYRRAADAAVPAGESLTVGRLAIAYGLLATPRSGRALATTTGDDLLVAEAREQLGPNP